LQLGPAKIIEHCTDATFDGRYFHLGYLEVFSRMVVENAKEAATTRSVIKNYMEWLLCTWGLVHPMKLVTNDIRVDLDGAGVELQPVP
jgi:hypothetical protein